MGGRRVGGLGQSVCALLVRLGLVVVVGLGALPARAADTPEGRFDVQTFRPWAGPQDLVMLAQSRPLSHLSFAAGAYLSFTLDPLSLVNTVTGEKVLGVVSNRLQLDATAGVGVKDWAEFGLVLPIVLFQSSGNLRDIGSEGFLNSTVLSDLRVYGKVAIPKFRRKPEGKGLGMAVTFNVGLPTGSGANFASDGTVTVQPGVVLDYRFKGGALVGVNAGVWVRPHVRFLDLELGSFFSFATGGEVPVVRRWGVTVVGNLFGNVPIDPPARSIQQTSFEFLLGLRWYSSSGVTVTVGGGGGDCGLGSATVRFFTSLVWVPKRTREWAALERFKKPPPPDPDPDKDGVIDKYDRCPTVRGPVENSGCPDTDRDKDGIVDRLDRCPDDPGRSGTRDGCPRVSIRDNKIVIVEQVHFATDLDVILPESFPVLEEVAGVMRHHPELERVLVEGHTDIRASDSYNIDLSQRRAEAVVRFLVSQGVEPERVHGQGFGRRRPIADNATEEGRALNRRVEFTIEKMGTPPGGVLPSANKSPLIDNKVLPGRQGVLPKTAAPHGVLPRRDQVLPNRDKVLPNVPEPKRPQQGGPPKRRPLGDPVPPQSATP